VSVREASRHPASRNGDGVKVVATGGVRKSVWLIAAAALLVSAAAFLLFFVARTSDAPPPPAPTPPPRVAAAAPPKPESKDVVAPPVRRNVRPVTRAPQATAGAPPATEPPAHEDAPVGFGPPGQKTGIALFPPRDTKPIKIGIVVPDDYEVPEGYVRHYQAGDDGEMLPAILMFHPDYEWIDEAGHRIELPPDRIVPPELAPPNLPIHMLEVPASAQEGAR
jgi:hypothetical protein